MSDLDKDLRHRIAQALTTRCSASLAPAWTANLR